MSTRVGLRGHRVQNEARAADRRREILLAAARVFARDGYLAATLDDVAAQMGVTKGVIYYYFRGKEEIYTEIRATAIREAIERLEAIIARGDPPGETLRAAVHDLVAHIFDDLDRYANVLRAGQKLSAASQARVRDLQRRYEQLLVGVVTAGVAAGEFRPHDPRLTVFTLLRAALGVADWYRPGGRLAPALIEAQVTEQLVRGVLLEPGAGASPARRRGPAAGGETG